MKSYGKTGFFATVTVVLAAVLLVSHTSFAAIDNEAKSYSAMSSEEETAAPVSEEGYVLGGWETTGSIGMSAVRSETGMTAGAQFSYKADPAYAFYLEPGLVLAFLPDLALFNFQFGARYDIILPDTSVRPFAKFSVGPTFQTQGDTLIFNAFAGAGVIYPANRWLDIRAEAGLTSLGGSAGFQFLAGLGF